MSLALVVILHYPFCFIADKAEVSLHLDAKRDFRGTILPVFGFKYLFLLPFDLSSRGLTSFMPVIILGILITLVGLDSLALVYTLCPGRTHTNTVYLVRPQLGHSSTYKLNLMARSALV